MNDRINDQLAELKAGQAAQSAQTSGIASTLKDMNAAIHKLLDDHEVRIRRLELAVVAIALGGGSAAAKVMGLI